MDTSANCAIKRQDVVRLQLKRPDFRCIASIRIAADGRHSITNCMITSNGGIQSQYLGNGVLPKSREIPGPPKKRKKKTP